MISGNATIHVVPASSASGEDRTCLSDEETNRAASFRFNEDALRWIAFRAALRRTLGVSIGIEPRKVPIVLTELGKPVLGPPFASLHFNLSHCNDLALIVISTDGPVGVDIEPRNRAVDLVGCETSFCHPSEIQNLPLDSNARTQRLMEIWTAKEALLKALGTGFMLAPDTVRIRFNEHPIRAVCDPPIAGMENQVIRQLSHPMLNDHCAAVSTPATVNRIEFIEPQGSTSGRSLI